jgi:L-threonylcarbamoyladenylate synthase
MRAKGLGPVSREDGAPGVPKKRQLSSEPGDIDNRRPGPYHEGAPEHGMAEQANTLIFGVDPTAADASGLRAVAAILAADGVMAYPTETFYGLGAAAFSEKAVHRVFLLKAREAGKPLSLIVSGMDMVERIAAEPPSAFYVLAGEFWPGPLTIVLKAAPTFPTALAGPGHTVAVRIPPAAWLRALVDELGLPVTATSANVSGRKEISDPAEVRRLFEGKVDVIIDGGMTPGGLPSTIVDLSGPEPAILREGAVPAASVRACLGLEPRA